MRIIVGLVVCVPLMTHAQIKAPWSEHGGAAVQVSAPGSVVAVTAAGSAGSERDEPVATSSIGSTTQQLLSLQARMDRAGAPHATLGATSERAWERYLKSFDHAIPEWFDVEVTSDTSR